MRRLLLDPSTPGWSLRGVGTNFNGPSLIRRPAWLPPTPGVAGRYLLYFAHHAGRSIRLAWADDLAGPWMIHPPGTLRLEQTRFTDHIASPDVHVDPPRQRLVMYYHGLGHPQAPPQLEQVTCRAFSRDGLHWQDDPRPLAASYLRTFFWRDRRYGIAMPGIFYRAAQPGTDHRGPFERRDETIAGPLMGLDASAIQLHRKPRHFAVRVVGDILELYFSRAGDRPERILGCRITLTQDWNRWHPGSVYDVLAPRHPWEGAALPRRASRGGAVHGPAHELRDPAIFQEDGRVILLYTVAGEAGIAAATLPDPTADRQANP